ncbi:MAG: MFS transporter, partial [Xanthobacteraceae bacterium]
MATAALHSRDANKREERRALGVACGAHALHDGYTDLIYVLLPIWQAEFGLGYAEIGLLRGAFAGAMAAFQVPAGMIAERVGASTMLAAGTALIAAAFVLAGTVTG